MLHCKIISNKKQLSEHRIIVVEIIAPGFFDLKDKYTAIEWREICHVNLLFSEFQVIVVKIPILIVNFTVEETRKDKEKESEICVCHRNFQPALRCYLHTIWDRNLIYGWKKVYVCLCVNRLKRWYNIYLFDSHMAIRSNKTLHRSVPSRHWKRWRHSESNHDVMFESSTRGTTFALKELWISIGIKSHQCYHKECEQLLI